MGRLWGGLELESRLEMGMAVASADRLKPPQLFSSATRNCRSSGWPAPRALALLLLLAAVAGAAGVQAPTRAPGRRRRANELTLDEQLVQCSEIPELQDLPHTPKVHGWCR